MTALDVSFAPAGGCIGLARKNASQSRLAAMIHEKDDIRLSDSVKTACLKAILGADGVFQRLSRHLKQELVGIDGATVLDYRGNVISAGAIIQIPHGSAEGARLSAARELANLVLALRCLVMVASRVFPPTHPTKSFSCSRSLECCPASVNPLDHLSVPKRARLRIRIVFLGQMVIRSSPKSLCWSQAFDRAKACI